MVRINPSCIKAKLVSRNYLNMFNLNSNNELFFPSYNWQAFLVKNFLIEAHRSSRKHQNFICNIRPKQLRIDKSCSSGENLWSYKIMKVFVETDRPVLKLISKSLNDLFEELNKSLSFKAIQESMFRQ